MQSRLAIAYTQMVRFSVPYAYGTIFRTISVWLYRTRIRMWYVPYAYGTKYAYGIEHVAINCFVVINLYV